MLDGNYIRSRQTDKNVAVIDLLHKKILDSAEGILSILCLFCLAVQIRESIERTIDGKDAEPSADEGIVDLTVEGKILFDFNHSLDITPCAVVIDGPWGIVKEWYDRAMALHKENIELKSKIKELEEMLNESNKKARKK